MTKQEEIREELAMVLAHIDGRYWNDLTVVEAGDYIKKTESVVIKVDGELPSPDFENSRIGVEQFNHQLDIRKKMVEAGYVAVESLIGT